MSLRVWDASECVLMLIDYQDHVLDDWKLLVADEWRKLAPLYYDEIAALQRAPEFQTPHGFTAAKKA